jgi:hypothetical protein
MPNVLLRLPAGCAALALLALVAGCGTRPPATPPTDPGCMAALAGTGARFSPWPAAPGGACGVDQPLILEHAGPALVPPLKTSCAMAAAWAGFTPELNRLARAEAGAPVAAVLTAGSWSCRSMSGNSRRPSLHATARAIDVRGFRLADGRRIDVARDWYRPDAAGRFLRAVGKAACRHFQVVLGPPADRFHHDHLHVDIGPWRLCQVG